MAESRTPNRPAPRADYGAPVDAYFAAQSPSVRSVLDAVRALITEVAPDAVGVIKWGFPMFEIDGKPLGALRATKAGVTVLLAAPAADLPDPHGRLEGTAKEMRGLKLARVEDIDSAELKSWIAITATRARARA